MTRRHAPRCSSTLPKRLVACCLLLAAAAAPAGSLQTGESLPALALRDQHAKALPVAPDTRIIFFAAEMASSQVMAKALEGLPPTALRDRKAIYIADISRMPEPISTIVAMPRMRQLPYPVAVVRHAADAALLPRRHGAVTVLRSEGGRISAVDYAQTPAQVSHYLK
ncbi:hypothetical protein [Ramlibacter sp.]|uniref:hypothetical protein n=1 Tax=Ramlibacter sp. TaxID=1917967 RepID=UPI002C1D2493|nr:hypothetical protein [Ramlibacter sp.]HWI82014.1 hypothetical protein [Ramlibacter sp.]